MDCKHARLLLMFARDRSHLDASDAQGLQEHLGHCPECDGLAASERRLDQSLGRAMRDVPVPAGLKERLLTKLTPPSRPWILRRWVIVPAALAACLLVAVGLSWRILFPAPITLEARADFKSYTLTEVNTEEVENWFKDRNVAMAFPTFLDKDRLDSISIGYHQGKPVAKLLFVATEDNRTQIAHVLCLEESRFKAEKETKIEGSNPTFMVLKPSGNGFLYLVICPNSLDPFKRKGNGGGL